MQRQAHVVIVGCLASLASAEWLRGDAAAWALLAALAGLGAVALAVWTAPPLVVYGAAILSACAISLTRPVHYAVLPELSESPEQLTASNSVSSTVEGLGIFLGPVLNSALIALEGPGTVCAAFALLMLLAAGATVRLRLLGVAEERGEVELEPTSSGTAIKWVSTFEPKFPGTGWLMRRALDWGLVSE